MRSYRFILLFLLASGIQACRTNPAATKDKDPITAAKDSQTINWISFQELEAQGTKNSRKVFIDVYTDWCGWCKKMDKETFSDPNVAKYLNKHFYAVKFNAESQEDIVLNGKTYKYNPKYKVNELAVELLQGKLGYPSTVYLDENKKLIAPVMGYLDIPTLNNLLRFYDGNHYKKQTFEEYQASQL